MTMRRALASPPSSSIARPLTIGGLSHPRPHWRRSIAVDRRPTRTAATAAERADGDDAGTDAGAGAQPPTTTTRRALLLLAAATATATTSAPPPALAGLFSPGGDKPQKAQAAAAPAAGGWSLSPPEGWTLAYDRTTAAARGDAAGSDSGPKVMWANFATLGTIVVSRTTRREARWPADLRADTPEPADPAAAALALADALLADARDSPATYGWRVLASASRTLPRGAASPPPPSSATASPSPQPAVRAYDVEYVQQVCRGEVLEASGGGRRCANPRNDDDLEVVSRHFLLTACLDPVTDVVWVVRGSCPSEAWPRAGAAIAEAVQSFAFSASAGGSAADAASRP